LLAAGDTRSNCVERGIMFLLRTQRKDGSWWEKTYTGTGFPKVFYLKYHMYAEYFPLLALATYSQVMKSLQRADKVSNSASDAQSSAAEGAHLGLD
jgi:squalene-hopene/tetraprenyl-beta-curcumene cyclase